MRKKENRQEIRKPTGCGPWVTASSSATSPTGRSPWASDSRFSIEDGANDFVVAGAAAQVAGQPVAHLVFGGIWVLVEQRLGRHDETRGADTALQGRVFEKFLLQRMQP